MLLTYRRVGRISVPAALAAVGAVVIVGGIALVAVGIAMIALVVVGVAACGVWLLRAIGRIGRAERRAPVQDGRIIEGVVVHSSEPPGNFDQQPHEQDHGGANDEDRHRTQ